jgi:hypothetical protein
MRRALVLALAALAFAPAAHAASVAASAAPGRVGVGDPFRYTVVARVASPRGDVRVLADPGAFDILAGPSVSRSSEGGTTVVRVTETLACLGRGCAPNAKPRGVALPRPVMLVGRASTSGAAASIVVAPRVPASAVAASRARYLRQTDPAGLTARLPLGLAAALAVLVALALVALAAWLVVSELRRRSEPAAAVAGRRTRGLEAALRLLRESARRPVPDRRRAADLVARLAGPEAAGDAQRVAWSQPAPQPDDVSSLADEVERTT